LTSQWLRDALEIIDSKIPGFSKFILKAMEKYRDKSSSEDDVCLFIDVIRKFYGNEILNIIITLLSDDYKKKFKDSLNHCNL
jgi:hypothetical protein